MINVNIGGINALSTNDAEGLAISIFFQGCPFCCKGCHNPELQPFGVGQQTTTDEIMKEITKNISWYDSIAFIGGEPLVQREALIDLLSKTKKLGLKRWVYTGYEAKDVPEEIKELADVIVAGPYIEELNTGGFPASSNQIIIRK